MSHCLATDNCFWPTGCPDRGRCNESGHCRRQADHTHEVFNGPSTGESPLGLKETSPGSLGEGPPNSVHDHGNCELCDWLEKERALNSHRLDWLDKHCAFVADEEYKIGPFAVGELRQLADAGIAADWVNERIGGAQYIKHSRSALSANPSATMGTEVTPASDNAKPPTVRLVFNKVTKKIDKVRSGDGLVIESFEPPCDYYKQPHAVGGVKGQAASANAPETPSVNQAVFGSVLAVGEPCPGGWIGPPDASLRQWYCRCGAKRPEQCVTETAEKSKAGKLVYNKATKRIDKVRSGDGLILESFEPPIEE